MSWTPICVLDPSLCPGPLCQRPRGSGCAFHSLFPWICPIFGPAKPWGLLARPGHPFPPGIFGDVDYFSAKGAEWRLPGAAAPGIKSWNSDEEKLGEVGGGSGSPGTGEGQERRDPGSSRQGLDPLGRNSSGIRLFPARRGRLRGRAAALERPGKLEDLVGATLGTLRARGHSFGRERRRHRTDLRRV